MQIAVFLESILLVLALSTDAFTASFAYGSSKIKIPFISTCIITFICSGLLAVSLIFGSIIQEWILPMITTLFCFAILFFLGLTKLFNSLIKALIRKNKMPRKKFKFSMFHIKFILNVYADPQEADLDESRSLSAGEAISLAIALSLDGLAAGFGMALVSSSWWIIILFSLGFNILAIVFGSFAGRKTAERTELDFSWIGGIILIVLAISKLL